MCKEIIDNQSSKIEKSERINRKQNTSKSIQPYVRDRDVALCMFSNLDQLIGLSPTKQGLWSWHFQKNLGLA